MPFLIWRKNWQEPILNLLRLTVYYSEDSCLIIKWGRDEKNSYLDAYEFFAD